MSLHQNKPSLDASFLTIASNLSSLSNLVNMPASKNALGERSGNIPGGHAQTGGANKKRKSDSTENIIDPDDVDLPSDFGSEWSANQVRAKIRQFINSGEMKVGEFQNKIGISSTGYARFMSQNGPDKGVGSDTFWAAAEFFKRRELAELKMPKGNKKRKTTGASVDTNNSSAQASSTPGTGAVGGGTGSQKSKKPSKKEEAEALEHANDVSDIHLDGESTDSVPVYDTCDDVRTKINRFQRETPSATNASFIRLITAALPSSSAHSPTARQLPAFLGKRGPTDGAESPVFYASYVFFEKLRVKRGKPKSKKRLEMEEKWKGGGSESKGMLLQDMGKRRIFAMKGSRPYIDQFGELQDTGMHGLR